MKKLVLLTTSFPRSKPGSEAAGSFVVDLCKSLSELCHVAVVAPGKDNTIERQKNFDVYRYRTPDKPLSEMRLYHPRDVADVFRILSAGAKATNRATEDIDPNALIALWALPCGFWARNAARRARIPFIIWCLGSDIWSLGKVPVVKNVLKGVLQDADYVYADGHQLARDVTALQGRHCDFLPSSRVIDLGSSLPCRTGPPFRFVFIGRWHPNKGPDLLLQALAMLCTEDWRLIERIDIYGGGVLRSVVESEVQKLSVQHPVHMHGYIDKAEAVAAIRHADWVIIPSRIESIPVIFSDAMQCRRPVICTPVGDLPELCKRQEIGICVKDISPGSLAKGIKQALNTNPERFESGIDSYAEVFNLRSVARHLAGLSNAHGVNNSGVPKPGLH